MMQVDNIVVDGRNPSHQQSLLATILKVFLNKPWDVAFKQKNVGANKKGLKTVTIEVLQTMVLSIIKSYVPRIKDFIGWTIEEPLYCNHESLFKSLNQM